MSKSKKLAYLILAHTDANQLRRLINSLNYKADFYIHLDKKKNINDFLYDLNIYNKNIHFIDERYNINWAGFNMVLATKALIKEAVNSNDDYNHIILLSGLDYPIEDKKYIYHFFEQKQNVEFIRGFSITDCNCKHCKNKIKRYWINDFKISKYNIFNKLLRKSVYILSSLKKKSDYIYIGSDKFKVCFGSQWWAITPECANYIMEFCEKNEKFDEYFKFCFAPDELYFHTIIFNSYFKNKTVLGGLEEYSSRWNWNNIHFLDGSKLGCEYIEDSKEKIKNIKKENKNSTSFYNESNLDEIILSNQLFIRKVDTTHSSKLLDIIDELKFK
ncbi:beta-1,6-N-acetylglucosaminyltransferase [Paraclostridium bifermentans]|uniref:beta-1,6-N-acetylglucosaminyltransferase n=1 Tax=Paraclostridium bifermentans TaxID=1490 RepID=UPI001C81AA90|nr:beta-1,6-N-acetylglucosaminyltransferase [Paraclostridium bifermentans]GIM33804.1 glycosyl transferase [Paraclostridium bifermentans subsp. muricolitidis]